MAVGDTTEAYFTIYNQPKSYTSYFIQGVCFWSWYDAAKCRKVFKATSVKDRQWALFHWNVEWRKHKTISLHLVTAWCDFGKTLHLFARVAIDYIFARKQTQNSQVIYLLKRSGPGMISHLLTFHQHPVVWESSLVRQGSLLSDHGQDAAGHLSDPVRTWDCQWTTMLFRGIWRSLRPIGLLGFNLLRKPW